MFGWRQAIDLLKDNLRYHHEAGNFKFSLGDGSILVSEIENLTLSLIASLANECSPSFRIGRPNGKYKSVKYRKPSSRRKFVALIFLLSKVLELALSNKTSTKRQIYYENISHFHDQKEVDRTLGDLAGLLNVPIWQLRIHGTAKGLFAGPLTYEIDGNVFYGDNKGLVIPQDVMKMENISSTAQWILLIEKDATFQKIIQDSALERLGPCLLITGKGFPDVNTRIFVRILWEELRIPVLALVDGDPHGIDIMCVYRFGSIAMSAHSNDLACSAVRWLGIHPTDIRRLSIDHQPLTASDTIKISRMVKRDYIRKNVLLRRELQILETGGVKAEIEGLTKISATYLIDNYIPSKLTCGECI